MAMKKALLFALGATGPALLAQASAVDSDGSGVPNCGQGVGDLLKQKGNLAACAACHGQAAQLMYGASLADGLGYTMCIPEDQRPSAEGASSTAEAVRMPKAAPCPQQALEALGDARADAVAAEICSACLGSGAGLQFVPSTTAHVSAGRTLCRAGDGRDARSDESPAAPEAGSAGAPELGPRRLRGSKAPSDCGGAESMGEGEGDLRGDKSAAEACSQCLGPNAKLHFFADSGTGSGRTYCRIAPARSGHFHALSDIVSKILLGRAAAAGAPPVTGAAASLFSM